MAVLSVAPTKSNLLALGRQLAFAEEGYDLLEQKRQILVFELLGRLRRARVVEQQLAAILARAHAALREALLDAGAVALDRAADGVGLAHGIQLAEQRLMGLRLPRVTAQLVSQVTPLGIGSSPASADAAQRQFLAALPLLAELAELDNAIFRLAHELRRTQRRCNALLKIFLPDYRETMAYLRATLEEREREAFIILKMIRARLARDGAP